MIRAVHDYEYIQIQYEYYGVITMTIWLQHIQFLVEYIWLLYNYNMIMIQYDPHI